MRVYDTENSRYEFDDEKMVYRRTALRSEDGNESHRLKYGVWLPYVSAEIVPLYKDNSVVLHIMAPDSVLGVYTSPLRNTKLVVQITDEDIGV